MQDFYVSESSHAFGNYSLDNKHVSWLALSTSCNGLNTPVDRKAQAVPVFTRDPLRQASSFSWYVS